MKTKTKTIIKIINNKNVRVQGITPLSNWCKHIALIFADDGSFIGRQKINFKEKTFKFANKTYNFLPDNCTSFIIPNTFSKSKYYIYNINNPMPFLLNKNPTPVLDSAVYKNILDADLIKKLNDLEKNSFLDFLTNPKVFIPILVICALGYWWFSTHSGNVATATTNTTNIIKGAIK